MIGPTLPWYMTRTTTAEIRCPWSRRDVTVRYLMCGGRPIGLVGCSDPNCSMPCLSGALPPDTVPPAVRFEVEEDRVPHRR